MTASVLACQDHLLIVTTYWCSLFSALVLFLRFVLHPVTTRLEARRQRIMKGQR